MKHYTKLFFAAAVAALGLASCAKEVATVETPKDNLVTVHFGATAGIEGATKATLTTEDELTFTSAWENGDELSVKYANDNETVGATTSGIVSASWSTDHFETTMPEYTGMWDYNVVYPAPNTESKVDFGSTRTQKGNAYNSKYDLMKGGAIEVDADAGKTADGKNIVFEMTRQTAIAYFHLTSTLDEEVVSAKLSVEGNGAYLSTSDVQIGKDNSGNIDYAKGYVFTETEGVASKEINLTFDAGTAPMSSDFKLWFNVLPTIYDKMTLTVETANHTLTISRTAEGMYEAGKLYKVVKKEIPAEKWVKKGGGDTPTEASYTIEFNSKTKGESPLAETTKATTLIIHGSEYVIAQPFSLVSNCYYGGDAANGLPLRIGTKSAAGSITIALSELGQYNATKIILSAKQYSKGKNKSIGVNGSTKQQPGDDYTELSFNLYNSDIESIKLDSDGYIYVKSITVIGTPLPPKYNVNVSKNIEGGEIFSTLGKYAEGSEVVLTPRAQNGYEFGEWSVVAADGTSIDVVDNKFTMPAQDVTVSCTFVKISYTITKAPAENGSFTVKLGDTEVNTAQFRDKLTLTATPNEGYSLEKWIVTYMDGETEKSFNPSGTFNMPAANVTVSASFVEAASIPVYASVAELIAAGEPTTTGTKVTVTLSDEEITDLHKVSGGRYTNGVFFMVGTQKVEVYCRDTPSDWKVGGTISGTLTNCDWKLFVDKKTQKATWELCPADYSELTYKAPLTSCATPVITVAEDGAVSIACETAGATIHYTVGENPADPTEADAVFSAVTLTEGQTIKAIAVAEGYKPSAVASKKYTVGSETAKTYTLTFANSYGDTGTNGYTTSWEATRNGFTWTMANWNNNRYQNNWTFVRAGSKKAASVATITTNKAMPEAISTVTMTIDAITTTSVNSIKLDVLSADNNIKETITGEAKKGDCVFKITNPQQDCKYKITVDCQKGSGNGFVQVSKVVYTNN